MQRDYRNLRARWFAAAGREQRAALEPEMRRFAARWAGDERARSVSIFLAWIRIDQELLPEARTLIAQARSRPGAADFVTVTEAAIASRAGDPERALSLLEPLSGKIVDSDERLVHGEELVRAALAARRFERAFQGMLEWLVQAPPDRQDAVRREVGALLKGVPSQDAEHALQLSSAALARNSASVELATARRWLSKTLFTELARRALDAGDGLLARSLLPHAPPEARASSEYAALARQAAQGSAAPRIAGRAVGLFLSVGTDEARRRSAALAAGLSRGLESAAPRVELVMRDDAGAPERGTATLAALAGDGAAILIAGVDDQAALQATIFAERARIPLLLVRNVTSEETRKYSFVLAPSDGELVSLLEASLKARGRQQIARVGQQGIPCSAPAAIAGKPRFPLEEWNKQRVDAVIVLGTAGCARDLLRELGGARQPPLVACGLECSESVLLSGGPALGVKTGTFPAGRSDWYEALGRDAAALARAALADFPEQRVVDQAQVGELHARARSALERVEVALETSDLRGFGGKHVLPRTLGVVDRGPRP